MTRGCQSVVVQRVDKVDKISWEDKIRFQTHHNSRSDNAEVCLVTAIKIFHKLPTSPGDDGAIFEKRTFENPSRCCCANKNYAAIDIVVERMVWDWCADRRSSKGMLSTCRKVTLKACALFMLNVESLASQTRHSRDVHCARENYKFHRKISPESRIYSDTNQTPHILLNISLLSTKSETFSSHNSPPRHLGVFISELAVPIACEYLQFAS